MPKSSGYYSEAQRKFFHTDTAKKKGITKADVEKRDKEYKKGISKKSKKLPNHSRQSKNSQQIKRSNSRNI